MYLACGDKVIRENQKKLHAYHKKKIADFELLPFWKKIGKRLLILNYYHFGKKLVKDC